MSNVVVDASVVLKCFLYEDGSEAAMTLLEDIKSFRAPDILLLEVDAVLSKKVRKREMQVPDSMGTWEKVRGLPYLPVPYNKIEEFAFRLATEFSITLYDACYLAVAVDYDATLFTADKRLANGMSNTPFGRYIKALQY